MWRPELAWAVQARLTLGQVEQLRQVNNWLRDRGRDRDVLPLRERSLEVLGHEKTLDALLSTTVFAPNRLTLDLLRTFRSHPPLPVVRVGDGPVLLVVENDDTFHSIRTVLVTDPGPVGHVAWGAGGAFEASVRSCGDLPGVERVRYFGDLDAAGLRIPRNAARTAAREGQPDVTPAHALYRSLLATGVRQGGQPAVPAEQSATLTAWLDEPFIAQECSALLEARMRVPQEALTFTALSSERGWLNDL
ncbi:MAG: Wadjet anti-phage system protein JetD domain-containing protein [Phycicoccus sp.]